SPVSAVFWLSGWWLPGASARLARPLLPAPAPPPPAPPPPPPPPPPRLPALDELRITNHFSCAQLNCSLLFGVGGGDR
ncbi:hypothetical protein, partial [Nocardia cyriacigeorgica]|uniref:hypothetical protein n=1 Tax=Nocardia cyriacigeorgica TaxID=135487 RepID=UPI0024562529